MQARLGLVQSQTNTIQQIKASLLCFWRKHGCIEVDPYDLPIGAATFHMAMPLSLVNQKMRKIMFFQRCRRPKDARGYDGQDRLMQMTQFQVVIAPSPTAIQELVCNSLYACGIDKGSISFVENNWNSPTLSAFGKGYEILCYGREVMQFTYFQKFGGEDLEIVPVELAYGVERIAMCVQKCEDIFNLLYDVNSDSQVYYRDVYGLFESRHAVANYNEELLRNCLNTYLDLNLSDEAVAKNAVVSYENLIMANYVFNLLEFGQYLSIYERNAIVARLKRKAEGIIASLREAFVKDTSLYAA